MVGYVHRMSELVLIAAQAPVRKVLGQRAIMGAKRLDRGLESRPTGLDCRVWVDLGRARDLRFQRVLHESAPGEPAEHQGSDQPSNHKPTELWKSGYGELDALRTMSERYTLIDARRANRFEHTLEISELHQGTLSRPPQACEGIRRDSHSHSVLRP